MLYGTSRRTRSILARAAAGALYHAAEDDKGGAGGDDKKPDAKPDAKKPDAPAPKKVELTEDELNERIESAKKSERDALAEKQKKADEDRQRKEDEEKGNFKKLADEEKSKREEAEREREQMKLELKKRDVQEDIRAYLKDKHSDYIGAEKWILPHIEFDAATAKEDITKRVKAAADQYVADNPRSKLPSVPSGQRKLGNDAPPPKADDQRANGNGNLYANPALRL